MVCCVFCLSSLTYDSSFKSWYLVLSNLVGLICTSGLTYAEGRWNPQTQQILVDHEDGQEETVSGPDSGNRCPPPPHQDGYQPTTVDDHQEVHPLANHIHCQQEANLPKKKRGFGRLK